MPCKDPKLVWIERGPKWELTPMPCGKSDCRPCQYSKLCDYVGRCLAEAAYSRASYCLTLTYAPDPDWDRVTVPSRRDGADVAITPSHFQKFIRKLRRRGHVVRYCAAAEFGERKGRVHFHAALFFKDSPKALPDWPDDCDFWAPEWPHGHIRGVWSQSHKSFAYVCKYILKDVERPGHWFMPSKKPLLGWEFFEEKAQYLAARHLWPASFQYMPPGGNRRLPYVMSGATRRDFMARLIELRGFSPPEGTVNEWVYASARKVAKHKVLQEAKNLDYAQLWEEYVASERADREADAANASAFDVRVRMDEEARWRESQR